MAVEEKAKKNGVWTNPFSGRYEPFVDEKGFGKFHLAYLNSTSKPVSLENTETSSRDSSHTTNHMITTSEDMVVRSTDNNHSDTVEQDQAILKRILADAPISMDHVQAMAGQQQPTSTHRSSHSPMTHRKMEPKKPNEPLSPYLRFSQKLLGDMKKACVGEENFLKVTETSLQAAWKSLDEKERTLYQTEYEAEKVGYYSLMEDYKKALQGKLAEENKPIAPKPQIQPENDAVDPNDPLASLIKHINHLKQQSRAIEGDLMTPEASSLQALGEKLITNCVVEKGLSEPCPNVNPFPLAALLQPQDQTSESQKQILQQRLIDRIKNTGPVSGAVTTLTNSSYISPIPAVRMEPSPKTNLQVGTLDSDNVRLLKLLIPNFNQVGGAAPPNYTAVPVNNVATARSPQPPQPQSVQYSSNTPQASQQQQQKTNKQSVVMDNEKCLEMFQNIKKQISDQAVFNLTATIHETSNESEGLILVVTRNKIDIHPQFGPIHVARVVITNKLYYKFFVLDKVVDSGQVGCKEISEVFWKLSEVSQHLLCPGFNQRYISKVEQTLGEKVEDITTSYCRLTAKMCTVWHQKDSKPGQYRNYHTRDLCSECLDLYHRLQFKTYSHTKLKAGTTTTQKREQDQPQPVQAAKKPKLNGQQFHSNGVPVRSPFPKEVQQVPGAPINDQQLKAVLSNLVANSRVVQVNKDSDGDDLVDILGEDTPPQTMHPTIQQQQISSQLSSSLALQLSSSLASQLNTSLASQLNTSLSSQLNTSLSSQLNTSLSSQLSSPLLPTGLPSLVPTDKANNDRSSTFSPSPMEVTAVSSVPTPAAVQSSIPPNIRVMPNTNTQPTFMLANGSVVQQPNTDVSANSKINEILASLNELQKSVPELVGTDSVDEGIRNLLKQFQSSASNMFPTPPPVFSSADRQQTDSTVFSAANSTVFPPANSSGSNVFSPSPQNTLPDLQLEAPQTETLEESPPESSPLDACTEAMGADESGCDQEDFLVIQED